MAHGVEQAQNVDDDVGQVAVPVVDDEVQVDVVRRSEAAARQRAGDRHGPDERRDCDELADEGQGEIEVSTRVGAVGERSAANRARLTERIALDDETLGYRQVRISGDRPANLRIGHSPAQAELGEAGRTDRVPAPVQQRHGSADSVPNRARGLRRVADAHLSGYGFGFRGMIETQDQRGGGQMTADGHFQVPQPANEPVRSYAPSDPHRKSLKSRLAELTDARTEVPMLIGHQRRWGGSRGDIRSPHRHELAIAEYAVGGAKDFDDAINAALGARKMWAATAYHERAAVLLRAAALLAGPWRDTINAATMLGQSKTVHQAEIDAACETIDFWRYNAFFGDQLLRNQPYNDGTAWNRPSTGPLGDSSSRAAPSISPRSPATLPPARCPMATPSAFNPAPQPRPVVHFR